jgi:DHA1 family bicyclomycin/chloramphenicol resistance-like MFS transporter
MFSVLGFFLGSMSGGRFLLARLGIDRTIMLGTTISTGAAALMFLVYEASGLSIVGILGPMFLFVFGFGLSMPAAMAGAVGHRPMIAGTGSALAGFLQMGMAGVSSLIIAWIYDGTGLPMVVQMMGMIACAMTANLVLQIRRRREIAAPGGLGE